MDKTNKMADELQDEASYKKKIGITIILFGWIAVLISVIFLFILVHLMSPIVRFGRVYFL